MVSVAVKVLLYRVLLPVALLFGALTRPSFISLVYAFFALLGPLLPSISANARVPPLVKGYFVVVLVFSLLASIGQLTYQIYENVSQPNVNGYTNQCNQSITQYWLRQAGFIRIKHDVGFDTVRVILAEVLAITASLLTCIVCLALSHQEPPAVAHRQTSYVQPVRSMSGTPRRPASKSRFTGALLAALKRLSDVSLVLLIGVVGIIQPCLLNAVYFLTFLFVCTWWATYTPLRRRCFNGIKVALLFYSAVHFLVIFAFQIQYFQELIIGRLYPPDILPLAARLLGLSPILHFECVAWWSLRVISSQYWTTLANALLVLLLYHAIIVQHSWTRYGVQRSYDNTASGGSSVHEELLAEDDELAQRESLPLQRVTSSAVDRQKITAIFVGPEGTGNITSQGLISILTFCIRHSYVFALLAMMLWALLYHSVFGLVFLFEACLFWVIRNTRFISFKASPVILAYAEFLLVVQYVFSMDLEAGSELPKSNLLELIGFVIASSRTAAFVTLLVKGALCLPLFVLLRLHLREKFYDSLTEHERQKRLTYGTFTAPDSEGVLASGASDESRGAQALSWVTKALAKYWIFVVAIVLLLVSLPSPPVLYTVGYFIFFGLLLSLLQVSLGLFRNSLYAYLTFLIIYTSLVLLSVYCYQFTGVPQWWHNATGLDDDWNNDIGLINYKGNEDAGGLFARLIAPISLFVVAMLQLKFFHDPWKKYVTPPREAVIPPDAGLSEDVSSFWEKARRICRSFVEFLWRLTEVHISKIVMLVLVIIAINDICALNMVIVLIISLAICFPAISSALSVFLCVYITVFAVARMIYQMHFISENVTEVLTDAPSLCNLTAGVPLSTTQWLGFHKEYDIGSYLAGLIVALVMLSLQVIVYYRQRHVRQMRGQSSPTRGLVFPEAIDARDWDSSLLKSFKFFLNYGFYKFGLEISMSMMVVVAWVRMDLIGTLLLLWLFFFCCVSRVTCRRIWPIFIIYVAVTFAVQYALYVGLPPVLCIDYPWSNWLANQRQNDNLVLWLDLASYRIQLNARYTVADFFLLMLVACQEYAFLAERNDHPAGNNKSAYADGSYTLAKANPYYDYVANPRNLVDVLKIAVFMYGHWATLVMVLIAGLGGVSLFALGYIVLAFWMLWQGNNLYSMKNYRRTLNRWKALLLYTVFVMFWKSALQIVGCAFIHLLWKHNLCYLRQLFSIVCVSKAANLPNNYYFDEQPAFDNSCVVQTSETEIGFDTFAFAFIVLQMRILHSYYFQHCIVDFRSEAVLANRGALLTNQLIEKEMKEQNAQQAKKFREIKDRTARIRVRYEELQQHGGSQAFIPQSYGQAKRAGDYYMFDYDPNADELVAPVESFVPEVTPGASDFDKLDPAQLLHTAVQHDLDLAGTLGAVESAEKIKDEEQRMIKAVSSSDEERAQRDEADGAGDEDEAGPSTASKSPTPAAEPEQTSGGGKICAIVRFIQKIVLSALDWTAAFLNRRSRDHRYVAYVLSKEKANLRRELKEPLMDVSRPLLRVREEFERSSLHCVSSESDIERLENEALDNWQQRNVFARLITAVGHCVAAHTDILCYLVAVIDHARSAGLLSLPLPLLVFFWGTLASPRPAKLFWVVMIGYTELCVVIKFICQFGFFPWNETSSEIKHADSYNFPPGILGIRMESYYASWDIVLLVALFFHRYMLRKMGLWKDANISDTFVAENGTENNVELHNDPAIEARDVEAQLPEEGAQIDTNGEEPAAAPKRGLIANFFYQLFHPKFRYIRDLYPFMFLLDVLCFFVVSFGFSAFGRGGSGSVVKDISSNRVPITFVVMLMVLSFMIVIDRALYLRKAVLCKLVYQFIIVIFIHVWIFFVLPSITYQAAWLNKTAQFLYVVKCVYLLISAWQIRNGYPKLCIGNLITHAYGLANMIFFKIFMAVPFLFELRTAIDWTWTDTSMPLFDYFNMENFYATIYSLKCARTFEQNFPAERGVKKGVVVKYLMGVPMILVLILIIWLPLLAFSLLNRIGMELLPVKVQMTISVEGYPPLFSIDSQGIELSELTQAEYNFVQDRFSEIVGDSDTKLRARQAVAFISEYTPNDVQKIRFRPESEMPWAISADALGAMKFELMNGSADINAIIKLQFERRRSPDSKEPIVHSSTIFVPLRKNSDARNSLILLLESNKTESRNVTLQHALPPYVIVPNEGEVKTPPALLAVMHKPLSLVDSSLSSIVMKLEGEQQSQVWIAQQELDNITSALTLESEETKYSQGRGLKYMQMVAFVDRVFPSMISKYVQGGIIAMYVAVVLLVGRLIRGIITNAPLDVIISEIPNPDYLLKICLDIYLVREAKDFVLEQDLFAKLIFLFRSPATLIKWTRYKVKAD